MIDTFSGIKYEELQSIPTYNQYQHNIKFSEISKLAVYLHITYLYHQALKFSEMASPTEKRFASLSTREQIHAPVFSRPSENGFVQIHLLEHCYRSGLTTLKTRDAYVRRKAAGILI
jgi:hypothetical protein